MYIDKSKYVGKFNADLRDGFGELNFSCGDIF